MFDSDPTSISPSQRLAQAHAALENEEPLPSPADASDDGSDSTPRPASKATNGIAREVNFSDESAFPSLGSGTKAAPPKSLWGNTRSNGAVNLVASQVVSASELVTETVKLEASQQQPRSLGRNNAGDVIKRLQKETDTTIQMSTAQKTGTTTFLIRGKPESVAAARRTLMKEMGKKVRQQISVW